MKIDRFWLIQIVVISSILLLITLYVFLMNHQVQANQTLVPSVSVSLADKGACTENGTPPTSADISASLSSNDPARQSKCFDFLHNESMDGDLAAKLWLGRAYHNGWGVERNIPEAIRQYTKAATSKDEEIHKAAVQWLSIAQKES